ncbi:hypothetical protein [Arthrobacter sp. STN4]|uniref:hypothetical protein n=1 Tax=Arthrobacter sp. STN4 TaxID=2923276 RepID=UPI00211A99F8|nr:hypothetical protein [Arthrobacter sp. STN4]MCQ9163000.1 hypothetical protein [Arthrobacter sp. STN4]
MADPMVASRRPRRPSRAPWFQLTYGRPHHSVLSPGSPTVEPATAMATAHDPPTRTTVPTDQLGAERAG